MRTGLKARTKAKAEHRHDWRVPIISGFIAKHLRARSPALSRFGKIALQRTDLKVPAEISPDALRGRHGT